MVSLSLSSTTLLIALIGSMLNVRITNGNLEEIDSATITNFSDFKTRTVNDKDVIISTTETEKEIQISVAANKCRISDVVEKFNHHYSNLSVKCVGVINLTTSLEEIPQNMVPHITSIFISNSTVTTLNLTLFQKFSILQNLSVTKSNVSFIIGAIPNSLKVLNLSRNHLRSVNALSPSFERYIKKGTNNNGTTTIHNSVTNATFLSESGESHLLNSSNNSVSDVDSSKNNTIFGVITLSELDLSHNKITELPKFLFHLGGGQLSLRLSGNHLKCEFVWEKLWEWTEMPSSKTNHTILSDSDETFCGIDEDVRVFQYTVARVLQARKDLERTCSTVDKSLCRDCRLYALQKEGHHHHQDSIPHKKVDQENTTTTTISNDDDDEMRISISLKLDCSSQNLTQLPPIPRQTWQLNISHNLIKDLSPLKGPMYSNLLILDGKDNQINLDSLAGTPFIDKYNYLNLQNNGFTVIPASMLTSLRTMRGQGVTLFGENYIDCDCTSVKEIKPLLIENSKRIRDMKDIYCKDTNKTRVKDLQYSDVCHLDSSDSSDFTSELYLYLIILGEIVLIIVIIAKVWHDQRTFRRTGHLPWCSSKMPRLPCDAMLESLKEPANLGGGGSAASSNVNMHNVSLSASNIQLKDMKGSGGGSGGGSVCSNKSSTPQIQQGHSSRTSSV